MNDVSLKEYVESRLCALDKQMDAAVQNIKESTSASFAASQKAIDKQENFQTIYNAGHNDLSRKMEAQYKEMIPRSEHQLTIERVIDNIQSLRESRSQTEGKGIGARELLAYIIAAVSIGGAVIAFLK